MNDERTLNNIIEIIKDSSKSKNCLVLSHQNPDGDTLGSMLALGEILKILGHKVDRVISDPVPEVYKFLPFTNLVKIPGDSSLCEKYEIAFSLDCGSVKRLAQAHKFWKSAITTINIDHHISNEKFGKVNWIEADATSTGQMIFWLAKNANINISGEVATLLYTTLLTDTGCFSNSNTNSEALSWGGELIRLGAEHLNVYRKVFLEKPFKAIKIFGESLGNLNLIENGEIAWTYVSKDILESLSATGEDTEDIADHMMRTKGVKVGVFFREDKNEIKVSLRSNSEFDVSKIAIANGGGGHKRASGINIKSPFVEVKDLILNKVIEEYRKINDK